METKKFNCKIESLPVMGSFLMLSFDVDNPSFVKYSPMFNDPFAENLKLKITACGNMISVEELVQQQKLITKSLEESIKAVRLLMNPLEGYLKIASGLDVAISDFGIKKVRDGISSKRPEETISGLKLVTSNFLRNKTVLVTVGCDAKTDEVLNQVITELTDLNEQQNVFKNKCVRTSEEIIKEYNQLWDMMNPVFVAGKAIFKGKDEVKLREYTFSTLKRRVEGSNKSTSEKPDETAVA